MDRRIFITRMIGLPLVATVSMRVLAADECNDQVEELGQGVKSFGFYQGLSPNETRDPARTDGTYYKMPCILRGDIDAGVDKTYTFWHGHNGQDHGFTITAADFRKLKDGHNIEIFTTVIDGHRHALKVTLTEPCAVS